MIATLALAVAHLGSGSASAPLERLEKVPFSQVQIEDRFWAPRQETNRKVSVAHSLDMLDKFGYVRNFEIAARREREGFSGLVFMDSDLYKVLESASYTLATHPDPALDKRLDAIIAKLAAAQMPDGYLNTFYQIKDPDHRLSNLRDNHEIYCAGHLFEAAAAHFQATGKRNLLDVASKYADFFARTFGSGPGQRMGYCGHPEAELALIKLWRATGKQSFFDLARFFIENRGTHFFAKEHNTPEDRYDGSYWQDDVPIYDHRNIKGHAVRAAYLMSGATDVGGAIGDQRLLDMVDRVWRNCVERNVYVTGGIGPSARNEGFTKDYDLPNLTAYQETCASVAMVFWNHRLALLYGDSKYADAMETALYNGALAGVSLSGDKFFYVNPLASAGGHHRSEWFSCACCPPNITRLLASLGDYAYATSKDALWVNLYIGGSVEASVDGGSVRLAIQTEYPWDGKVKIVVGAGRPSSRFGLRLRVPGWCRGALVSINGSKVGNPSLERGYLVLNRTWNDGDVVQLELPMPVRRVAANPNVAEDRGMLALARGPMVYCMEQADNPKPVGQAAISPTAKVAAVKRGGLLGGVTVLEGEGLSGAGEWKGGLYGSYAEPTPFKFTAVPYYAWDNREPGAMRVWMPVLPPLPEVSGFERSARVSLSNVTGLCSPESIHNGIEPKSSADHPGDLCHFWPRKGTSDDWVRYDWSLPVTLSSARVYWFDDTGFGECRTPLSWSLQYLDGETWRPVKLSDERTGFSVALDRWCEVSFEPVTTRSMRLEFAMKPNWSVGIHEWQVFGQESSEIN